MGQTAPGSTGTGPRTPVRVENGRKRVRAYLDGHLVADTVRPLLVWERPYYPTYYIPLADVRARLVPTGRTHDSPGRGTAEVLDVERSNLYRKMRAFGILPSRRPEPEEEAV